MTETDIVRSILQALELRRVFAWRANSGSILIGEGRSKRMIRGAPAGTPDIIGCLPGGRLFGLEVKTERGRLRPAQADWAQRACATGARWALVRSAAQALSVIDDWSKEAA
jgi:hypothetical protein